MKIEKYVFEDSLSDSLGKCIVSHFNPKYHQLPLVQPVLASVNARAFLLPADTFKVNVTTFQFKVIVLEHK